MADQTNRLTDAEQDAEEKRLLLEIEAINAEVARRRASAQATKEIRIALARLRDVED